MPAGLYKPYLQGSTPKIVEPKYPGLRLIDCRCRHRSGEESSRCNGTRLLAGARSAMSARTALRVGAVRALMCVALFTIPAPLTASQYLRSEWQVGQTRISAADLEVIAPSPAPSEVDLEAAVRIALERNLGFRRTVQDLLGARSNWQVVRQRWTLDLFGSVERTGDGETLDARQAGAAFSYAATTGADFSVVAELDRLESDETEQTITAFLRQPLLAGQGNASAAYEEVRQARTSYRAALLAFFIDRQSLIERVVSAYFDAVQQKQLVDIQDFSVTLAEQAVEDAQLRLDAGLIPEIDLTRAQLRLARERTAAVTQRQRLQDAMDGLLALLGLEVGGMPELVTEVPYQAQSLDLQVLVAHALELRPDLRLVDLAIEDREAALRVSRSERLPSLDLFGGWARQRNGLDETSWSIGLGLSVPIGSLSLEEAVRRARWDLLVSEQAREDLRQQVIAEVRRQVRAAEAARVNVEIASQSVEVAKRSLHIAERMVEEGLRTNRDVLDAQDDLTRSQTSLVSSKINYYLALVRLRVAVGLDILPTLSPGGLSPFSGGEAASVAGAAD